MGIPFEWLSNAARHLGTTQAAANSTASILGEAALPAANGDPPSDNVACMPNSREEEPDNTNPEEDKKAKHNPDDNKKMSAVRHAAKDPDDDRKIPAVECPHQDSAPAAHAGTSPGVARATERSVSTKDAPEWLRNNGVTISINGVIQPDRLIPPLCNTGLMASGHRSSA